MTVKTSRSTLLALQPKQIKFDLDVGEQTLALYAQELTASQSDEVSKKSLGDDDDFNHENFQAHRILASIHDQKTNKPLFSEEDFEALKAIPASIINTLRLKVSKANNDLTKKEVDAAKKS